jgi:hypothetical protein
MTTNETNQDKTANLSTYFRELTAGEAIPRPENEEWEAKMSRIKFASGPAEIDDETYWYFLGTLPPRFMRENYFCFAEGMEPFQLFWERDGRYFARQLDWQQTRNFCRLAGIPVYR